jgi:hypothetical protein
MTVPHDEPHVKGDAEATDEATLPLDGGNIYVRQDGPRDAPRSCSSPCSRRP